MKQIGFIVIEFGFQGWLFIEVEVCVIEVKKYGFKFVGVFFLFVMYDLDFDLIFMVNKEFDVFEVVGGDYFIFVMDFGCDGYDDCFVFDEVGWKMLFINLDQICEVCVSCNVIVCLYFYWGMMVQNCDEVICVFENFLIGLCLDIGYLVCGGIDVVELVCKYVNCVDIVYVKDVYKEMVDKFLFGEIIWFEGICVGMFVFIGDGDIDFVVIVRFFDEVGFDGYYVLEQDIMIDEELFVDDGLIINVKKFYEVLVLLG